MFFKCECGQILNDIGYPNNVEHFLVNAYDRERLEHLVDKEVAENQVIDMWTEHWDESGAIPTWRCYVCERLYLNIGNGKEIIVYKVEKTRHPE